MIWVLTKYVLTAAFRDRLLLGFMLLLIVGISLSLFMGSSAITETDQFSLIFAASSLRISGNIALILFVVFYIRRAFEARDIEYLLSRPITKFQFLLAHFIGFSILAMMAAFLITLVLMGMPSFGSNTSLLTWGLSLWVEFNIIVTMAMFFSLMLSSAVTGSLATLAFYVLARLIGDILGIIDAGAVTNINVVFEKIMLIISVFVPRLDLMAQSAWLIYGADGAVNWVFLLSQGAIFTSFIFMAALLDLNKRQF